MLIDALHDTGALPSALHDTGELPGARHDTGEFTRARQDTGEVQKRPFQQKLFITANTLFRVQVFPARFLTALTLRIRQMYADRRCSLSDNEKQPPTGHARMTLHIEGGNDPRGGS